MELYHLIYTSVPAKLMNDHELQQLLNIAQEANQLYSVTGMLVCLPESYIQLIEGPRKHIKQLYENIQRDKRHLRVTTLREGSIEERFFPEWAMAFKKMNEHQAGQDIFSLQDDRVLQLFDIMER